KELQNPKLEQARQMTFGSPSPFNGERAAMRGETVRVSYISSAAVILLSLLARPRLRAGSAHWVRTEHHFIRRWAECKLVWFAERLFEILDEIAFAFPQDFVPFGFELLAH